MADPNQVAERIVALLLTTGNRSAGNTFIRRALRLSEKAYWPAQALLVQSGRAIRGTGRGGSLRLTAQFHPTATTSTSASPPSAAASGSQPQRGSPLGEPTAPGDPLVSVRVQRFAELLQGAPDVALDDYQRPYVWSPERIEQLVGDLTEHAKATPVSLDYYMGSILLHHDRDRGLRFIVDGQQRLTSLCLIHHRLHGTLPGGQALTFRSAESVANLRHARQRLDELEPTAAMLDRVCFTVITVSSEDLAFTFFDTQNNRGVPLGATDLLKAYHLRAVAGERSHELQRRCARLWEGVQRLPANAVTSGDTAAGLFEKVLWRGRRWTGQRALARESHAAVMEEFEKDSLPPSGGASIPVYASHHVARHASLSLGDDDQVAMSLAAPQGGTAPADMPFVLRQPVHRGLGFFLYTVKYAHLVQRLFHEVPRDREIAAVRTVDRLHQEAGLSPYLREVFWLGTVMYADRFETERLFEFALWLDHLLGAVRLQKHYVFKEAATNLLKDGSMNLLDVVGGAFRPDEVVAFMRRETWANEAYQVEPTHDGVQRRYAQAVLGFYGRTGSLRGKERWIAAKARTVTL